MPSQVLQVFAVAKPIHLPAAPLSRCCGVVAGGVSGHHAAQGSGGDGMGGGANGAQLVAVFVAKCLSFECFCFVVKSRQ